MYHLLVDLTTDLAIVDETLDEVDDTGLVPREEDILGDVLSTGQSHGGGASRLENITSTYHSHSS